MLQLTFSILLNVHKKTIFRLSCCFRFHNLYFYEETLFYNYIPYFGIHFLCCSSPRILLFVNTRFCVKFLCCSVRVSVLHSQLNWYVNSLVGHFAHWQSAKSCSAIMCSSNARLHPCAWPQHILFCKSSWCCNWHYILTILAYIPHETLL